MCTSKLSNGNESANELLTGIDRFSLRVLVLQALQGFVPSRYMTDEESFGVETDQESYIRTDDEDGGNTDWEENMRRWVNR